ncbi:MAG: methionine--tRNA ligase [Candidatus Paceibacterota bacterium]
MSENNFYITTTLPYVNAAPHMGHALEFIRADIVARYKEMLGYEVFLNTGTDEHGLKVYRKAAEEGKDPQEYADHYSEMFKKMVRSLGMKEDHNFIRTTDEHHVRAAQAFWKRCLKNGDIYKKNYKVNYCVGCEMEKTHSDLVGGECPEHPGQELEVIEEENYFFRFSRYQGALLELYDERSDLVIPDFRLNEIRSFVERGIEDFSISRLAEKQPWGIPVPNDPDHTMYVWFDALINYISAIGWPDDMESFRKWWPVTQYAGKDNLRQQSAMWQAMLLSAGLPLSEKVIINGFVISGGQKMSKSIGNVIDPFDLIERYGSEALRYYTARELHPFEDSDMTEERFKEAYNANLANGLGNAFSRIMKMAYNYGVDYEPLPTKDEILAKKEVKENYHRAFDSFEINKAADHIWAKISDLDRHIEETKPFLKVKTDPEQASKDVVFLVHGIFEVALLLEPIMPETARKIKNSISDRQPPDSPLFMRKE